MSRLASIAIVVCSATGLTLGGCSLVLPRLTAPACEMNSDCEDLNSQFPERVTACVRFRCDELLNRCVLGPLDQDGDGHPPVAVCGGDDCDDDEALAFEGNEEACDGIDNDCNDLIDDSIVVTSSAGVAASGVGALTALSWSADEAGALALSSTAGIGGLGHLNGMTGTVEALSLRALAETDNLDLAALSGAGCPSPTGDGRPSPSCQLTQVAVAAGEPVSWAAFINREGCDDGQLRVGLLDVPSSTLELMGPDARSNTWRGVDLVGSCTRTAAGSGATAPAIVTATPGTGSPETAVLGWLRDRATRTCAGAPAEVAVLGLWRATGVVSGMTGVDWVVASGAGTPSVLGTTNGIAAPALAATGTGETIVAFGDAAGGVRVAIVEALPTVGPAPAPDSTPALSLGESVLAGTGSADQVALVVSPAPDGTLRIGLTWTAGCGGGPVRFVPIVWNRGARTLSPGTPIELSSARGVTPTITFVPHGFIRPTAIRASTIVAEDDGGWFVAWRDESAEPTLVARRVLAVDGATVDEAAVPFAGDLSADPRWPFVYPGASEHTVRGGFFAAESQAIVGASFLCP